MGGNPLLGYDVANRKLVANEAEAETVRFIFQRYLDLGCVRLLSADLAKRKIGSKRRVFADGRQVGGKPMGRSSLYALLGNRVYVGETVHKGASYKGEHKVIVPRALFDAVQKQLAELGPALSGKARTAQGGKRENSLFRSCTSCSGERLKCANGAGTRQTRRAARGIAMSGIENGTAWNPDKPCSAKGQDSGANRTATRGGCDRHLLIGQRPADAHRC